MTQGEKLDEQSIIRFIKSLNISDNNKSNLLSLTPESYIGKASDIIKQL